MKSRLLLIAGACLCAVGLSACCSQPKQSEPVKKEVGIQLYSVRELIGVFGKSEGDYKPVLQALAEMGYTSVEAASYKDGLIYGQTPEQFRQDVEAAGMKVLSTHCTFNLSDEEMRRNYVSSLKDTVMFRDIMQRYSLKDGRLLDDLFTYVVNNAASLVSVRNIINWFTLI